MSDYEAFKIHGLLPGSDSDDSLSGKSDFDEVYYALQPPPLPLDNIKNRIIKIEPDGETGKKGKKIGYKQLHRYKNTEEKKWLQQHSSFNQNDGNPIELTKDYNPINCKLYEDSKENQSTRCSLQEDPAIKPLYQTPNINNFNQQNKGAIPKQRLAYSAALQRTTVPYSAMKSLENRNYETINSLNQNQRELKQSHLPEVSDKKSTILQIDDYPILNQPKFAARNSSSQQTSLVQNREQTNYDISVIGLGTPVAQNNPTLLSENSNEGCFNNFLNCIASTCCSLF